MPDPNDLPPESRAARRVLWEMKQQYNTSSRHKARVELAPLKKPPAPPGKPPKRSVSSPKPKKQPKRKHWGLRVLALLIVILLTSGGVFAYKILAAGNKITTAKQSVLGQLSDLLFASNQKLKGESDDRINILLMAVGGEGHSGENLTDTVMIASIRPSDKSVALLSVPRDLYVQVPGEQFYSKLNAVHAYGEAKNPGSGPALLEQKITEITGLKINYFARVDFTAFKNLVDAVGGVTVTIPNGFYDYWHKISFPAGTENMNGDRALAYVRARYVEGPEGGDFKRAARQQQMLVAIRDKVFSVNTALNFTRLDGILNSLSNNIKTDMQLWEIKRLYEIARQVDRTQIHSVVLSNSGVDGVLVSGTEILGGVPAYVLKPRAGNYSEIKQIAQNIFNAEDIATPAPGATPYPSPSDQPTPFPDATTGLVSGSTPPDATPTPVPATIEIRNGTHTAGLAKKISDILTAKKYTVSTVGNATNRAVTTTTVYALKGNQTDNAKAIAGILKAAADSGVPKGEAASTADILVIAGSDAAQ